MLPVRAITEFHPFLSPQLSVHCTGFNVHVVCHAVRRSCHVLQFQALSLLGIPSASRCALIATGGRRPAPRHRRHGNPQVLHHLPPQHRRLYQAPKAPAQHVASGAPRCSTCIMHPRSSVSHPTAGLPLGKGWQHLHTWPHGTRCMTASARPSPAPESTLRAGWGPQFSIQFCRCCDSSSTALSSLPFIMATHARFICASMIK